MERVKNGDGNTINKENVWPSQFGIYVFVTRKTKTLSENILDPNHRYTYFILKKINYLKNTEVSSIKS